jgi:3-(3-hydroxy-phenyl)propionate hydroxylase
MAADTDMSEAAKESVVTERLKRQFGEDVDFELVWVGPYGYRSQMLDSFQHGRVLFVGDVAHVMSPFGARGGNSAIQDADNLGWKLAAVVQGAASTTLLQTYSDERVQAAAENIEITRRTMRFLAPKPGIETLLRSAVLGLAKTQPFARSFVNTGRMSVANAYTASGLNVGHGAGKHVQNIALNVQGQPSNLLALMRQLGAGVLLLGLGGSAAAFTSALPAAMKVRYFDVDEHSSALAAQLGISQGLAIIRPDLYCAGTANWEDAPALLARFCAALGTPTC